MRTLQVSANASAMNYKRTGAEQDIHFTNKTQQSKKDKHCMLHLSTTYYARKYMNKFTKRHKWSIISSHHGYIVFLYTCMKLQKNEQKAIYVFISILICV